MKKGFLLIFVILLSYMGIGATRVINYDFDIISNKAYDLINGKIIEDANYNITSRIYLKSKNINFTSDIYHHILLWDKNNKYLGYLNSSGTSLQNEKYLEYYVTNSLKLEDNNNILDFVTSIAFMTFKTDRNYIHNYNNYSLTKNFNPSRNMYINDEIIINRNNLSDYYNIDYQIVNNTSNKLLQINLQDSTIENANLYITSLPNELQKSTYYQNSIYKNEIINNNGSLELIERVGRKIDNVNHAEISKCTWRVSEILKNSCYDNGDEVKINMHLGQKVFSGIEAIGFTIEKANTVVFNHIIGNLKLTATINTTSNIFPGVLSSNIANSNIDIELVGNNGSGNRMLHIAVNKSRLQGYRTDMSNEEKVTLFKQWLQEQATLGNPLTVTYQLAVIDPKEENLSLYNLDTSNINYDVYSFIKDNMHSDLNYRPIIINGILYHFGNDINTWREDDSMDDIFKVVVPKGVIIQQPYQLIYEYDIPTQEDLTNLYLDGYMSTSTYEAYLDELRFNNGYMYYRISENVTSLPNTYQLNPTEVNYINWNTNESINLLALSNNNQNFNLDLNIKTQLEVGNRFTFWQPYHINYNTTIIPNDFLQAYLDCIEKAYFNYSSMLGENSLNLLVVTHSEEIPIPIENKPIDEDINDFLEKFNFTSPFMKILLSFSILIAITIIIFIFKGSKILFLSILSVVFILLVMLGWLPFWLLMLLGMIIFGLFLISIKGDQNNE